MKFLRNDTELKQRRRELRRNQTEVEKVFRAEVQNRHFNGIRSFRQYRSGYR
jgi:very-short-patch-repair endonuclease